MPNAHFVAHTSKTAGVKYLFLPGVNLEDSALSTDEAELETLAEMGILRGGKNVVEGIELITSADACSWRITLPRLPKRPRHIMMTTEIAVQSFPAGGALNACFVAHQLGVPASQLFLCGPVGRGKDGRFIAGNVASRGIRHAFFPAGPGGTATTLSVHDAKGQSTLFTLKPAFKVEFRALQFLKGVAASAGVICAMSVKPKDLELVERLWKSRSAGGQLVFGPHAGLLSREDLKARWQALASVAKLCVMNDAEASFLVRRRFNRDDIEIVARMVGAEIVVVTMGTAGAVMKVRGEKVAAWQPAMMPEEVKGTSGAGDTFTGGMIAGLFQRGLNPREALRLGTLAAHCKVGSRCPWGGLPSLPEFNQTLASLG